MAIPCSKMQCKGYLNSRRVQTRDKWKWVDLLTSRRRWNWALLSNVSTKIWKSANSLQARTKWSWSTLWRMRNTTRSMAFRQPLRTGIESAGNDSSVACTPLILNAELPSTDIHRRLSFSCYGRVAAQWINACTSDIPLSYCTRWKDCKNSKWRERLFAVFIHNFKYSCTCATITCLPPSLLQEIPNESRMYTTSPTVLDVVWAYLTSCTVDKLRKYTKGRHLTRRMRKAEVASSLFHVLVGKEKLETMEQFGHELQGFTDWWKKNDRIKQWLVAPEPNTNEVSTRRSSFSLNEFSRLMSVLTTKNGIR